MGKTKSILALALAYLATLFYLAAMCTPWWFTKYYVPGGNNESGTLNSDAFYASNLGLREDSRLFSRSNCFIDGSCITGDTIYKNNGNLQWVFTTTLVLMILGWIPWLIFVHLLHARANKNRSPMKGRRTLMALTALLTMAFLLTAIIVFAAGIVKSSRIYNSEGLYGSVLSDGNFGSMPVGHDEGDRLAAGLPLSCHAFRGDEDEDEDNYNAFGRGVGNGFYNCNPINGTIAYKWGAHSAWYFAILALALIPLALLLGLLIRVRERVVTQERTVQRTVTTQPAVVQQPAQYVQPASYNQPHFSHTLGNQSV